MYTESFTPAVFAAAAPPMPAELLNETEQMSSAAHVAWNLDDLFTGIDDPRIEQTLQSSKSRADQFQQDYQGKINSPDLTAATLAAALRDLEIISLESAKPGTYASLRFAADTADPANQAFLQKMMERGSEISLPLIFFDIELAAIPDDTIARLMDDPQVAPYRHHIENVRLYRDHMLTETEERLLEETANTGGRAFRRLYEQVTSAQKFEFRGESMSPGGSQRPSLLPRPRRAPRSRRRDLARHRRLPAGRHLRLQHADAGQERQRPLAPLCRSRAVPPPR